MAAWRKQRGGAGESQPPSSGVTKAPIAAFSAQQPDFARWDNSPLTPEILQIIDQANSQMLMSMVTHSLSHLSIPLYALG